MSWYNESKKINFLTFEFFFMGIIIWILISLYLLCGTLVKNLCEQIPYLRECHMIKLLTLPHEVSTFIYIYIYIYWLIDLCWFQLSINIYIYINK